MSKLLGLTGDIGAGKDTVADILVAGGWCRVGLADPIKKAISDMFGLDQGYLADRRLKELPLYDIGVSPRNLMRTLGTEWGRKCVHPELWVMLAERRIVELLDLGHGVVVPDVRFKNERDMILRMGGTMGRVIRDNNPYRVYASDHESDKTLAFMAGEIILCNNGTLDGLVDEVLRSVNV